MSSNGSDEQVLPKIWKFKLQRVSGGYVRATVHGDSVDEVISEWEDVHMGLKQIGEAVERKEPDT